MRPTCSPDLEDESLWVPSSAAAYPPAHSAQETPAAAAAAAAAAAPCSRSPTPDSRDGFRDMADHDMPPRLVEDPAQLAHVPAPPS